eukprot:gene13181-biopygen4385
MRLGVACACACVGPYWVTPCLGAWAFPGAALHRSLRSMHTALNPPLSNVRGEEGAVRREVAQHGLLELDQGQRSHCLALISKPEG